MAVVRNPLKRSQVIRVNDNYDNQDIVVENELSENKQFTDMPKVAQLTQNSWNFSPYTREDVYKDVVISKPAKIGRIERYRGKDPNKYHKPR
jgi:hypothetical protein